MAIRGERSGRRGDSVAKAAQAGAPPPAVDGPPTWRALADLIQLVRRSNAPQLQLRLIAAIAMTLGGKGLGVLAPLVLGAAVNRLAAGQGAAVAVGLGFAGFAVGWAVVRLLSAIAPNAADVVFAPVRSAAQRTAATETFAHALSLSLDFHQTKRPGGGLPVAHPRLQPDPHRRRTGAGGRGARRAL
jgi:ATP-binding cassette subfamily B protein